MLVSTACVEATHESEPEMSQVIGSSSEEMNPTGVPSDLRRGQRREVRPRWAPVSMSHDVPGG